MENQKPTFPQLEAVYLPKFKTSKTKKAASDLLEVIFKYCVISPFDSTITYPGGRISTSSVGQLLDFFVCGEKASDMPPDAHLFIKFLKKIHFPTTNLCSIKMNK